MKNSRTPHPAALLIDEIIRLTPRIKTIFAEVNASLGLSAMELTVLSAIVNASHKPTVPQIGRSLGNPRQVIQGAVNKLIEKGLVETTINPDHKRAPLLLVTRRGREAKRNIDQRATTEMDALLSILSVAECERLWRDLHDLRVRIEAYLRGKKAAAASPKIASVPERILL